jgi:hypothetical protein
MQSIRNSIKIFSLIIVLTDFISCKKSATQSSSISVTIANGSNPTSFNINIYASSTLNSIRIKGFAYDPQSSATSLEITINQPSITKATYVENATGTPGLTIVYVNDFNFFGLYRSIDSYTNYNSPTNPFSITITDINSKSISGTFHGELQGVTTPSTKVVMTNGTFYGNL